MRLQRCRNGHFYDADQYRACPHCADADGRDNEKTEKYSIHLRTGDAASAQREEAESARTAGNRRMQSALGMTLEEGTSLKGGRAARRTEREPSQQRQARSPVVGVLICTRGAHLGEGFFLHAGSNLVGRGYGADIELVDETSVVSAGQAAVLFDSESGRFYIQLATGSALCYVNGEAVLSVRELHKNDRIGVGAALLMLIPCCDAAFDWRYGGDA